MARLINSLSRLEKILVRDKTMHSQENFVLREILQESIFKQFYTKVLLGEIKIDNSLVSIIAANRDETYDAMQMADTPAEAVDFLGSTGARSVYVSINPNPSDIVPGTFRGAISTELRKIGTELKHSLETGQIPRNFSSSYELDITRLGSYQGPRIAVFRDTNYFIKNGVDKRHTAIHDIVHEMRENPLYHFVDLPIIGMEKSNGGIKRRELDRESLSGFKDFNSVMMNHDLIEDGITENLRLFFNVAYDYFRELQHDVSYLGFSWRDELTQKGHSWAAKIDERFVYKLQNNLVAGKINNIFADAILTSCGLMHTVLGSDKATKEYGLVITGDSDIAAIKSILMQEIIPRYMASLTMQKIPESRIYAREDRFRRLTNIAREHIRYFGDSQFGSKISMGTIYNYNEQSIDTFAMTEPLTEFIRGKNPYVRAKTRLLHFAVEENRDIKSAYELILKGLRSGRTI